MTAQEKAALAWKKRRAAARKAGWQKCPGCNGCGHVREWQNHQNVGCEDCGGIGYLDPEDVLDLDEARKMREGP